MKDNKRTKHLTKEVLRLRVELRSAKLRIKLLNSKWDKWEERARTLYREKHGKDCPQ
ncbi:MAG: hypothetical protein WC680_05790 [Sulfuricurvum sp.]|jgi:hypothetical protein